MTKAADRSTWVDQQTHWSITRFLYDEAELLDEWRYAEWSQLISDNFWYRIPVPVTRDDPERGGYAEESFLVDESRISLEYWFRRHEHDQFRYAWGENPLQRLKRFVTNIRARESADGVTVKANVLLSFARQSDPAVLVAAEREDLLQQHGCSWLLANRTVLLQQNILETTHARIIF